MEYTLYNECIIYTDDKRDVPIRKIVTAAYLIICALGVTLSIIWPHWWMIIPSVVLFLIGSLIFWISTEEPWTPAKLQKRVDIPYGLQGRLNNKHIWNPTYMNAVETLFGLLREQKDIDSEEWAKAFSLMNKELAPLTAERKKRMQQRPDVDAYVNEIRTFNKLMEAGSWE